MSQGRPNILWYCTDHQRFDTIASLGYPFVNTPHLDRLASEGTAFTHAYCQNPVCTPSRASFLTGMYPIRTNMITSGCESYPAGFEELLISRILADAGYDCGLIGKLHLAGAYRGPEVRRADGYGFFEYSHMPYRWPGVVDDSYISWVKAAGYDPVEVVPEYDRAGLFDIGSAGWNGMKIPTSAKNNVPVEVHQTTWCTEKAIEFVSRPRNQPWLLSVNPFDPHPPLDPPLEYFQRYRPDSLPPAAFRESDLEHQAKLTDVPFSGPVCNPSEMGIQDIKAAFYAMIELIDEQFGRILTTLEETGQRDNTIVIFTSDHGDALGDHGLIMKGARFYEGHVRVPLIWSWPHNIESDLRSHALVELIDIVPTLLEAAKIEPRAEIQGRSLLPILTGRKEPHSHREFVRCEHCYKLSNGRTGYATMYRDNRWKLIRYHGQDLGELFDLSADPNEHESLWETSEFHSVKTELSLKSFDATILAANHGGPSIMPF